MSGPFSIGLTPTWYSPDERLKRFAILRTAAELFNERGFCETSLNELAKRLNVTKPSLYYYVKNKDDILLQILNQATIECTPAMPLAEQSGLSGLGKRKMVDDNYLRRRIDSAVLLPVLTRCLT